MSRAAHSANPTARTGPASTIKPPSFPSNLPLQANFADNHFIIGGGVAIFHVASSRVVVCRHSRDNYWFLPKGRRDVGESTEQAAEREGFEESGYRNRLLPLPLPHRQPQPRIPTDPRFSSFSTEPVFAQLYPATTTCQYLCFWYISETVPPDVEAALNAREAEVAATSDSVFGAQYQYPPPYPMDLTLKQRAALEKGRGSGGGSGERDGEGDNKKKGFCEPLKHEGTGMDLEEALYESHLLSVEEALQKLEPIPVMQYVVKVGWEAILKRLAME